MDEFGKRADYISLTEAAKNTPYSQEYLSLLARKGKLHTKKINGVWHTTREAVVIYIAERQKNLLQELEKRSTNSGSSPNLISDHSLITVEDKERGNKSDTNIRITNEKAFPLPRHSERSEESHSLSRDPSVVSLPQDDISFEFENKKKNHGVLFQILHHTALVAISSLLFFTIGTYALHYSSTHSEKEALERTNDTLASIIKTIAFPHHPVAFLGDIQKQTTRFAKKFGDALENAITPISRAIAKVFFGATRVSTNLVPDPRFREDDRGKETPTDPRRHSNPPIRHSERSEESQGGLREKSPSQDPSVASLPQDDKEKKEIASSASPPRNDTIRTTREIPESPIPSTLASVKMDILKNVEFLNHILREQFEKEFKDLRFTLSRTTTKTESNNRAITLTQKIDSLNGVTLSNASFTGSNSFDLKDKDIPDDITAGNYLPIKGGSITGTLTIGKNIDFSQVSTTTIPNATVNAYNISTSSAPVPFLTFDTSNYRIGIGTSSPGNTFSINGSFLVSGDTNIGGALTVSGTNSTSTLTAPFQITRAPTLAHAFSVWKIGAVGVNGSDASFVINPSSAAADTNLLSVIVGTTTKFLVDAEGDIFAKSLTTEGANVLSSTTASNFLVENNTYLGDAIGDVVFINSGTIQYNNRATSTLQNLTVNAFSLATSTTDVPIFTVDTNGLGRIGIGTTSPWGTLAVEQGTISPVFVVSDKGTSSPLFIVTGSGNVGIGTTSPGSLLSVQGGNAQITGTTTTHALVATSTLFVGGTTGSSMVVLQNGNVGIGTVSPDTITEIVDADPILTVRDTDTSQTTANSRLRLAESGASDTLDGYWDLEASPNSSAYDFHISNDTGGKRLTILKASGNLGIGTTSPGSLLSVQGGNAQITGTTTTHALVATSTLFVGPTGNLLTVTAAGRVGIGTAGPGGKLEVITSGGGAGTHTIRISDDSVGAFFGTVSNTKFSLISNNSNRLTIDTSGNLGIGTTSPPSLLSIGAQGTNGLFFNGNALGIGTSTPGAQFAIATTTAGANTTLLVSNLGSGYTAWFEDAANDTTPFVIDGSGNLGIGTTTPGSLLSVQGNAQITGTTTTHALVATSTLFVGPTGNLLTVNAAGNVGIGTMNPGGKLDVRDGNLVLTDADVAHGMTTLAATDIFGSLQPISATGGGLQIRGFSEGGGDALLFDGVLGTNNPTDTLPAVTFRSSKKDGGSSWTTLSDLETLFQLQNNTTPRLTVLGSGNLGIGTTTPGSLLSVQGVGNFVSAATSTLYTNLSLPYLTSTSTEATSSIAGPLYVASSTPGVFSAGAWFAVGPSSPLLWVDRDSGNVGIGTSSPARLYSGTGTTTGNIASSTYRFALSGGAYLDSNLITIASSSASLLTVNYQAAATTTIPNNQLYAFTIATSTTATPLLRFSTVANQRATTSITGGFSVDSGAFEYDSSSGVTSVDTLDIGSFSFDTDAGMVSWIDMPVATTTEKVVMSYSAQLDGLSLLTVYGESTPGGGVSTTTIGIGTTTPQWLLQIASTSPFFTISDTDAGTNLKHWTISSQGGFLYIASSSDAYATSSVPALTIATSSNVGIGTSSPSARLSIEGTCVDTGSGCASTDVAELYPASEPVSPGDIVAIDLEKPLHVKKAVSGAPLIGVVSTHPALTIEGSALQLLPSPLPDTMEKPAVALAGRVPVKVNNENGDIAIGERIALSSKPGVGRKAKGGEPSVGIALQPFSGEEGKVLVFVNLGYSKLDDEIASAESGLAMTDGGGWTIDQTTGKVTAGFTAGLDLKGNSLENVSKILSANGTWSIDENGKIVAEEVHAKKLCLGGTCITEEELKSLLDLRTNQTDETNQTPPPPPPPLAPPPPPPADTATSTQESDQSDQ